MPAAWGWPWTILTAALIGLILPTDIIAERFTPSITPTHLLLVSGLGQNAMLLTRTSMPPGLTASSPAYTAPTAAQLADEHAAWAWIGPSYAAGSAFPFAVLVSRVCEIAVTSQGRESGELPFFALRYFNGRVQIYNATGATTASGVEEYVASHWLPGVYSEMTAGESHICFLSTDRHVECKTTVNPFPAPSALMTHRSAETYTQITAASRFTCGIRAVDQFVECFGALGRDTSALTFVNYTSASVRAPNRASLVIRLFVRLLAPVLTDSSPFVPPVPHALCVCSLRYASIAAQFDSGFCGVVVDTGDLACYSVHAVGPLEAVALPAPIAPVSFLYPLWLFLDGSAQLPWSQACAMRSDGLIDCVLPLSAGIIPRPMTQVTMISSYVQGATTDSGQLQRADLTSGWSSIPEVNLFEVMQFIGVDLARGNDSICASVSLQSSLEVQSLAPCASLARAIDLLAHPNTWVQLLPTLSPYTANSLSLHYSDTTITSSPPSCLAPTELALLGNGSWAARMQETAVSGQVVTIDCTGALHCFSTLQSNMQFIGLTITGSTQHAIVSLSESSTNANSQLPDSTLTITDCVFDAMAAVLLKTKGSVVISDCTISNSLQWANTTRGLIELEDASLMMSGTSFAHNHMPVADTFVRSCLRSVSSLPVTLMISDSHWLNCSSSSTSADAPPGGRTHRTQTGTTWMALSGLLILCIVFARPTFSSGVAMQIQPNGKLVLSVTDSSFVLQAVRCFQCAGGPAPHTSIS